MATLEELQQIMVNNVVEVVEDDFLTPRTVLHHLRFSKEAARQLINMLEPYLTAPTRASAIDKHTKVLTALRFFGSGSYQTDIGLNLYSAVSQHSISNWLMEITNALNLPHISNQYIHFPRNNNANLQLTGNVITFWGRLLVEKDLGPTPSRSVDP